ncbi:MAG: single-stranded DNA-binding protein [Planctomycetia bacterium]|nr:single-stranded DNA-binding protein [Planctomycetia bacterium]
MGNVTRDPELRYIASGKAVTDIGLAVNERRKLPSGEWGEETTFVDVTLWDRNAEVAGEYVTKGSPLLIEGRLKLETWEKDGKKNSKLKVIGDRIVLLGSRGEGGGRAEGGKGSRPERPARAGAGRGSDGHDPSTEGSSSGYDAEPSGSGGMGDDDIPF